MNLLQDANLLLEEGDVVYIQSTGDWVQVARDTVEGYVAIPAPVAPMAIFGRYYVIAGPERLDSSED